MSLATPSESLVLGRYELHERIASGGMASVYLGRLRGAKGFARLVAIKRLHPQFALDPDFASMFLDEARVASRIRHANVVSVTDVEALENELFLVMDYVPGESLAALRRVSSEPAPPAVAARIVHDTLSGLQAAHDATDESGAPLEVIHRDVSPQNILVGVDGVSRLIDFGVAKAVGRLRATTDGEVKGKLAYMAPEQVRGETTTTSADLYATGVVLWELLAGRRLHDRESEAAVLVSVLTGDAPSIAGLPGVSTALAEVVERALRRDPLRRFAAASVMRHALDEACPPASHTDVAAWLMATAGDSIAQRASSAARVEAAVPMKGTWRSQEGERGPPESERGPALPPPTDSVAPVAGSDSTSRKTGVGLPRRTEKARGRPFIAAAGVLVLVLGTTVAGGRWARRARSAAEPPPAAASSASQGAEPGIVTVASDASAGQGSATSRSLIPASSVTGSMSHGAVPAVAAPSTPAHRASTVSARPQAPPSLGKRCDPPFSLDAGGRRIYKRECL